MKKDFLEFHIFGGKLTVDVPDVIIMSLAKKDVITDSVLLEELLKRASITESVVDDALLGVEPIDVSREAMSRFVEDLLRRYDQQTVEPGRLSEEDFDDIEHALPEDDTEDPEYIEEPEEQTEPSIDEDAAGIDIEALRRKKRIEWERSEQRKAEARFLEDNRDADEMFFRELKKGAPRTSWDKVFGDDARQAEPEPEGSLQYFHSESKTIHNLAERTAQLAYQASMATAIKGDENVEFHAVSKIVRESSLFAAALDRIGKNAAANLVDAHGMARDEAFETVNKIFSNGEKCPIDIADLHGNKYELRQKLGQLNIAPVEKRRILSHRIEIADALIARQSLLDYAASNQGRFSASQIDFIKSDSFFKHKGHSGEVSVVFGTYLRGSSNGMFRDINVGALSSKGMERLMKKAEEENVPLSMGEMAALHYLKEHKKMQRKLAAKRKGLIFRRARQKLQRAETAELKGLGKITQVARAASASVRTVTVTVKIMKSVLKTSDRVVNHMTRNNVQKWAARTCRRMGTGAQAVRKKANKKIKTVQKRRYDALPVEKKIKIDERRGRVEIRRQRTDSIKRERAERLRRREGKRDEKKRAGASRRRKNADGKNKFTGTIGRVWTFMTMPFQLAVDAYSAVKGVIMSIVSKVVLALAAVLLIIGLVFLVCSFISSWTTVVVTEDENIVLLEEEQMQELAGLINDKLQGVYDRALEKAKGRPTTETVKHDIPLYHYGSPRTEADRADFYHHDNVPEPTDDELSNGYHVHLLDSDGNALDSNVSNVKDIISVATVLLQNDNINFADIRDLCDDMSDGMILDFVANESDIYHSQYTTDVFPFDKDLYYCDDDDFYAEYDQAVSEGVMMYEEPVPMAPESPDADGCDEVEGRGCRSYTYTYTNADDEDITVRHWYCPGHDSLKASYGYIDVNIFITVLTKEDCFKAPDFSEAGFTISYKKPIDYMASSFEDASTYISFRNRYYAGRSVDLFSAFEDSGGWDYDTHTANALADPQTGQINCPDPFGEDWVNNKVKDGVELCAGNIEWVNRLYAQDWYKLYGITDFFLGDASALGSAFSDDELKKLIEDIAGDYGELSEARQAFVSYAAASVGKIAYYWGGKASCKDWYGNDFGKIITPDYKGRNIKGLDCSGFVQWVYWSVFGTKPGGTTTNLTSSLGLRQIPASALKPGDLGLVATPGAKSNHIGIYAGGGQWIHCSSSKGTTKGSYSAFIYYYALFND